jgi:hypothetical protein
LRREFIKVNLIQAALDSIIAFLALNLVLFLLNIKIIAASVHYRALALITLVFFLVDWVHRSRKYRLEIYEEKNPQLQEILRTARDNIENQNIVSQAMFDDLMNRARSVTSESIIPSTDIIKKIVLVGLLSFLTALSGIVDFQVQKETQQIFSRLEPGEILNQEPENLRNASEIYGEPQDIEASATNLEVNITGDAQGSESESLRNPEPEDFVFEAANPGMPDDVELAKRYSLAIKDFE